MFFRNNKKGSIYQTFLRVLGLIFISLLSFIFLYIIFGASYDYIILNLYNAGITSGVELVEQNSFKIVEMYQSLQINTWSDLVFLIFYIMQFTGTVVLVYTQKENTGALNFLSGVIYGTFIMLFIASFFIIIYNQLFYNVLLQLFGNFTLSLPLMEFFFKYIGVFLMVQGISLLLAKNITFDFFTDYGRKQNELKTFKQDSSDTTKDGGVF